MSIEAISSNSISYNKQDLEIELKKTDSKIVEYIESSKAIVLLGLIFATVFNPIVLGAFGACFLASHSFIILTGTSLLVGALVTFNTSVFIGLEKRKRELFQVRKKYFPRNLDQPLGIRNASCNCWANSMIQFIFNIPSLKQKITENGYSGRLFGLKSMLGRYLKESQDPGVFVSSVDSQILRKSIHSKSGLISSSPFHQEDPHEVFALISDILPNIYMRKKIQYSNKSMEQPKEYSKENGQALRLIDRNTFETETKENFNFISLPILPPGIVFNPSLVNLIDNFMNNSDVEAEVSVEFIGKSGENHRYPPKKESHRLISAPDDLLFSLKRFQKQIIQSGSESGKIECSYATEKIESAVTIPSVLHLKKRSHIVEANASYELDSFISHFGSCPDNGHYISCIKKNGVWYKCNDEKVEVISQNDALILVSKAYLIHFKKI